MILFRPTIHSLRKAIGIRSADVEAAAVARWKIAPKSKQYVPAAKFLPGQIERIVATEFAPITEVVRTFRGNYDVVQGETTGFLLRDVELADGVLYASNTTRHLRPRRRRISAYPGVIEMQSGALYETWLGNRWFGNWLTDDCLTYKLAAEHGTPVSTRDIGQFHEPSYARVLGLEAKRIDHVHFDELTMFNDLQQNDSRKARADDMRKRLIAITTAPSHAGVFLLRGNTGQSRVLINERVIAEQLASKYGFRVLDPSVSSLEEIVNACAGARVVAGVEGSHLVHGLIVMPPDAALLVIQPPSRVVSALKIITDRQGQTYAFVVGKGSTEKFSVDWSEFERTLEMVL